MVKVSVIVPVYQAEDFIRTCVQSILKQTYKNLEIILIDDGSEDNSFEICAELSKSDPRIKVFHQKNQGVSAARNKGIDKAQGDYLLFVDADDQIENDMVEYMVQKAVTCYSDIVICGFDYVYADRTEVQMPETEEGNYNRKFICENFVKLYSMGILHNIGTKLYSKKLLIQYNIKFNEKRTVLEDIQFCMDAVRSTDHIYVCTKSFYKYFMQINQNSIQKTYRENYYVNLQEFFHDIVETGVEKNKGFYLIYMDAILLTLKNEIYRKKRKAGVIIKAYREICNLDYVKEAEGYIKLRDVRFIKYIFYRNIWARRALILYILAYMWCLESGK